MGGLAGIVHFRGDPPDPAVVERMGARLAHRGPDGEGGYLEGPAAFTHRRRAILPTRSVQPLIDDDLVLMMDGWLYNHAAVLDELGVRGARADTYALLHGFRRWGADVPLHVEGSYAFAIWDRRNHTLHLFRDRMGIRPLFWARRGACFAFASELPALLEVPWVSRDLATEHLAEYLSFRVVHSPRTLLRDVHQVEPAHALRVNADELRSRPYWRPQYAAPHTRRPAEGAVVEALQAAVERAVERRLVPGAQTALYLSGGLGSTAIAAAARRKHRALPSFTISFADDPHPESPFAGRVARLLGLDHTEVVVGSGELAAAFRPGIRALGQPIGNPAAFLQLLMAERVARAARVVLSGDGGEELFGGRMLDGIVRKLRVAQAFAALPRPTRRLIGATIGRTPIGRRATTSPEDLPLALELGGYDLFDVGERKKLLTDEALARPEARQEVLTPFYAGLDTDPVNAVLHAHVRSWLQEESLPRADRTAAASGLDVRFPLLDNEVFAMAAALPGASKLRRAGGSLHTRWPLRAMLDGVLPPSLVNRPKRGMPVPLDPWLAGPGRLFLEERYATLRKNRFGWWNVAHLDELHRQVGKVTGVGLRLWSLFILEAWIDEVVGGSPASR